MANIVVPAQHARAALDAIWEWLKSQQTTGLGYSAVLPAEGTTPDGRKGSLWVPDVVLPILRQRGIPVGIA